MPTKSIALNKQTSCSRLTVSGDVN